MFFWNALLGVGFGITAFSYAECLPLMAAIQVVRAAYDVLAPKGFLGGGPTNYQLYVHILGEGGGPLPPVPWMRYSIMAIGSGVAIGSVTFGVWRLVFG